MITHPSYEKLETTLYLRGSEFVDKDPVFGVKTSLVTDLIWMEDVALAETYQVLLFEREIGKENRRGFWLLDRDFVLVPKQSKEGRKVHD